MVTNPVYKGEAVFNRMDSKTRKAKPASEHIVVKVDPIIDPATFDAVQAQLTDRKEEGRGGTLFDSRANLSVTFD